jgi:3-hydroxymyristoyl/3-hydroxydecanoyl-(acyl carrier protein) dehydratase
MTLWYESTFDSSNETGEISAHIQVPERSPWFDGHFPRMPLLPGIAQLGMVRDLLVRMHGPGTAVRRISRVRFKQMIRPGQAFRLTIKSGGHDGTHSFRITGDGGLICNGQIQLKTETT